MNKQDITPDEVTRQALKALGIEITPREEPIKDLSFGTDARGDYALFVDHSHINGWDIDAAVQDAIGNDEPTFFRVLWDGKAQPSHGWIEGNKIVQWG